MNIKLKILIVTGMLGVLIVLFTVLLSNNIILPGFIHVEDSKAEKNIIRVSDTLLEKIASIDATTNDYAIWDETYYAMLGENPEYRDTGITPGSLERTNIDFGVLVRNDGKIIFGREILSGTESEYDPESVDSQNNIIYSYIQKNYHSIICTDASTYYNGLINLPNGLAIISARPILKSDETGPISGTIVFGKMVDEDFIQGIIEQTHINISVSEYDASIDEERFKNSENPLIINHIDEGNISAEILLLDINEKPIAVLQTEEYREIYNEGKIAVKYLIKSMMIAVLIFIVLQYWFFNRFIISRLVAIEMQIVNIHDKKSGSSRVTIEGNDELALFGKAINDSLDLIENSSKETKIILDAYPYSYLYISSSLKIEDYKITGNIKETLEKKNIINLREVELSKIFSSEVFNKLINAIDDARTTCRPTKDMHTCKPAVTSFKFYGAQGVSTYEAKVVDIVKDNMSLIILEDISEREKYEEKLVETNKHLQDLDQAKTDFLNIASHELKTPLTAISAYIEILDDYKGKFNKEQLHGLDVIRRNSNQLKTIISNILEISRLDSGRFELNITEMDVKEKISLLVDNLKILSNNKKIKLKYTCSGINKINTDVMRFEEILNNLVGNAIKFTDKGSVTIKTESGKNSEKEFIVIYVIDTGIGVPKDKIKNLFDEFYQVNATISRKYGGTGLGLSITKKMIELQSGKITVSSTENKGTTFRFTLPIKPVVKNVSKKEAKSSDANKPKTNTEPSDEKNPVKSDKIQNVSKESSDENKNSKQINIKKIKNKK